MKISQFIARRYLFSKKSTNAINIISGISILVFFLGTAIILILLSFLNGLESLVFSMNDAFDPDIKVAPKYAKVFVPEKQKVDAILSLDGVNRVDSVLEENVVVRYGEAQEIAIMKGISSSRDLETRFDTLTISGTPVLKDDSNEYAIFSLNIASRLNLNISNDITPANIFVPRRGYDYNPLNPEQSLSSKFIYPSAIILISEDTDRDYVITPLKFAKQVLEYSDEISMLEISIDPKSDDAEMRDRIQRIMGDDFEVMDRYMQNESAYTVFQTEKWVTFAILVFVILIAGFNVVGALTMLVLEKKRDISLLRSMGATVSMIRGVFLREGMLITVYGATLGIIVGALFVILQESVGILRLDQGIVEYWPVEIRWPDVIVVYFTVIILGFILSLYPSWKSVRLTKEKLN